MLGLSLKRREGQSVLIDVPPSATPTRIKVTLYELLSAGRACITFNAPPEVRVVREEIDGKPTHPLSPRRAAR